MKNSYYVLARVSFLSLLTLFLSCSKDNTPSEQQLKSDLLGKWMTVSIDGQNCLTDEESVITYINDTYCLRSYGGAKTSQQLRWMNKRKFVYSVSGNVITEHGAWQDSTSTIDHVFVSEVKSISGDRMEISQIHKRNGEIVENNSSICLQKVNIDHTYAILGIWEGVYTSDNTYGDANHRWEYKKDGSFIYYSKDENGDWVKRESDNLYNEYFVDGYLLATRWIEKDSTENREWWNIKTCNEEKMEWEAVRQRDDGTQFTHTFIMKRVQSE